MRNQKSTSKTQAIILLFIAAFIVVSLLSYNANDNSLNVHDDEKIKNVGGFAGAIVADLLLQLCGFSSISLVLSIFSWSIISFAYGSISKMWIRIPAAFVALSSLSCCLGSFSSYNFASQMLPGGYIGYFLYGNLNGIIGSMVTILCSFLIFIVSFYTSINISPDTSGESSGNLFDRVSKHISAAIRTFFYIVTLRFIHDLIVDRKKIIILLKEMIVAKPSEKEPSLPQIQSQQARPVVPKIPQVQKVPSYLAPSIEMLNVGLSLDIPQLSPGAIDQRAQKLMKVLEDFGVRGSIINYFYGPVVTLFELRPHPGTKASRVIGLANDIARTMEVVSTRVSTVPGKDVIGIELPNPKRQTVFLRSLLESGAYTNTNLSIPMALGKTISGDPVIVDLVRMPHLLIAGTTGSGKSVGVSCMIMSMLYKLSPEKCKFVMIDPKMLEFSMYDGIPHLLTPVITNPKEAVSALKWVVSEMENRYKTMSSLGVRNITGYNEKVAISSSRNGKLVKEIDVGYNQETGEIIKEKVFIEAKHMPYIVVIIDEMADLMLVAGKEIESLVQRLAQMARAAGIHLIMATQRPSVDVITGVIKANFPTRISYHVTSKIDSRTILGEQGAEQLLGQGDMLYMASGGKLVRIHGPYVSDEEISRVVEDLKGKYQTEYIDLIPSGEEDNFNAGADFGEDTGDDMLYKQAVNIVLTEKRTSISYIQRKLRIGYNKAANMIEKMESDGVLSSPDVTGKRSILKNIQ